jgi:glycosyltransferase involved in cell wall biosynthesis
LTPAGSPEVTVVITTHNHARFLRDAIDSVRRQTFTDLELIVVDDGSTDDTPMVLAGAPGLETIRQARAGLSAARNSGWHAGRGRYVAFLDADDRLLPEALAVGVACLREHHDASFVSGHHVVIDAAGVQVSDPRRPCVTDRHYRALLRSNYIAMHATVLYRRETLEAYGGFDPTLPASEDYDLYLRVARLSPIVCHPHIVAEYRWHGGNMSRNHALMLSATLRVLARQRPHVRGRADLEQAYRDGVAFWQHLFGEPLLEELGTRVRAGGPWGDVTRLLGASLRHYPLGLVQRTGRYTRRLLGRKVSAR